MAKPAIPPEHEQAVYELARGADGIARKPGIAKAQDYLRGHRVECSDMAIRRLVERMNGNGGQPRQAEPVPTPPARTPAGPPEPDDDEPEPDEPPPTHYPTEEETLQFLRREMFLEVRTARAALTKRIKGASWQRYHSAVRVVGTLDAALDRKRQMDLDQGSGQALTPAEEAAAIEAARQHLSASYGLVAPEDLPPPPRADQAPN